MVTRIRLGIGITMALVSIVLMWGVGIASKQLYEIKGTIDPTNTQKITEIKTLANLPSVEKVKTEERATMAVDQLNFRRNSPTEIHYLIRSTDPLTEESRLVTDYNNNVIKSIVLWLLLGIGLLITILPFDDPE